MENKEVTKRSLKKTTSFWFLLVIYLTLLLNYRFVISINFDYLGFSSDHFSYLKFLVSSFTTLILITFTLFFKINFYKIIYIICLTLYFFGPSIFFIYNNSNFLIVLSMCIPLLFIFIIDKIDNNNNLKRKVININSKYTRMFIVAIILVLTIPFFRYIRTVNISNLWLEDIYLTRENIKSIDRGFLGYLLSPLSRVLLPFLFVYGMIKKNKFLVITSSLSLILMFLLNGAIKSIFFGIFCAALFAFGNYLRKEKNYLLLLTCFNICGFVFYILSGSLFINDYIRRLIFEPARLFQIYFQYYNNNFTYFKHTNIYAALTGTEKGMPISHFIGEYIIGIKGLNANTGIFVEGFISWGISGVVLVSIIFTAMLFLLSKFNLSNHFFGIFAAYLYIFNTSFIETLFITHGFLFLIFFSFFFIPKEKRIPKPIDKL